MDHKLEEVREEEVESNNSGNWEQPQGLKVMIFLVILAPGKRKTCVEAPI